MKVNKTQALLYMYVTLMKKGHLIKSEIQSELMINNLTFARYIQELRAFFYNFYLDYDIEYNKKDDTYFLVEK